MKVLCIAAHPDDEVLGCGATLARLSREGHQVYIAVLGEGITSRSSSSKKSHTDSIQRLHRQAKEVTRLLGACHLYQHKLPDNRFDMIPLLEIVKIIEKLITKLQPKRIYTHHKGDLNIDHSIVHRAVLTAVRPLQDCPVQELYAFEVPSSTEWSFQQFESAFHPNVFVDVEETLDIKIEALQVYKSEIQPFPHPRSPEIIRAIALRWGATAGVRYAEAFELIRSVC